MIAGVGGVLLTIVVIILVIGIALGVSWSGRD